MKFDFTDLNTPRLSETEELVRRRASKFVAYLETFDKTIPAQKLLAENVPSVSFDNQELNGGMHESYTRKIRLSPISERFPLEKAEKILTHELGHGVGKSSHSENAHASVDVEKNRTYIPDAIALDRALKGRVTTRSGLSSETVRVKRKQLLNPQSPHEYTAYGFFNGFNEAITDQIAKMVMDDELTYDEFSKIDGYAYAHERNILNIACRSMSHVLHIPPNEVFKIFVRSYVHGWQPELKRALLKTFGPNALRVAAVMEARGYGKDNDDWSEQETHDRHDRKLLQLFYPFFDISIPSERREQIAQQILKRTGIPYKK